MEFISRKTAKFWMSKVVLRTSNQNELHLFRVLEKTSLKLLNARSHLLFCETSLNNNLLPNFTNISLSDDATRPPSIEENCRGDLLEHQISKQVKAITELEDAVDNATTELKTAIGEGIRYQAHLCHLDRVLDKREAALEITHKRKLCHLYGSDILIKKERETLVNLSNAEVDVNVKQVMRLGLNCHIKKQIQCPN